MTRSTFLAAAFLVLLTGSAVADGCDDYAAQAVSTAAFIQKSGCFGTTTGGTNPISFVGPRWSTDFAYHANYCRARGGAVADDYVEYFGGTIDCYRCSGYAQESVNQTQAAIDLKCGFDGPEWENRYLRDQVQACFNENPILEKSTGKKTTNEDRAEKLAVCKREADIRAKLSAVNPTFSKKRRSLEGQVGISRGNAVIDAVSDPNCLRCKSKVLNELKPQTTSQSSTSKVIGPGLLEGDSGFTQQRPSAAGVLPSPSGNAGGSGIVGKSRSY